MNNAFDIFVSPLSRRPLTVKNGFLITEDGSERYEIRRGVPVLLPPDVQPEWNRELIEAILWQYPDTVTQMYAEIKRCGRKCDPNLFYHKYIEKTLKDKQGIIDALEQYARSDTEQWRVEDNTSEKDFRRLSRWLTGRDRVKYVQRSSRTNHYPHYTSEVLKSNPKTILELSTGAGTGTAAICKSKPSDCNVYTMDIDWVCHGNTVGIGKYLSCRDTLIPVTANFWWMPFANGFFDTVCSHYGLDESRENTLTFAETARVLKNSGRFVVTSRKNSFMRQCGVLKKFGFTESETVELMKKCRMYADTETMVEECGKVGLMLENQKEFQISEKHVAVVSVFVKK